MTREQEALLAQACASPIVHMDETGWRENGQNGYVWGLVTPGPEPVCSYAYDRSRRPGAPL
jgi:Transposase IS66 family